MHLLHCGGVCAYYGVNKLYIQGAVRAWSKTCLGSSEVGLEDSLHLIYKIQNTQGSADVGEKSGLLQTPPWLYL